MSDASYLPEATPNSDTAPSEAQLLIVSFLKGAGTTHTSSLRRLTGLGSDRLQAELDQLQTVGLIRSTDESGLEIANTIFKHFGERLYRLREGYAENPHYQRYVGSEKSLRGAATERGFWAGFESAVWRYFGTAYALVLLLYIGRVLADMFLGQPLGGLANTGELFGLLCPVLALTVANARSMPVFADSESSAGSIARSFAVTLISRIGLVLVPITFVIAALPETAVGRLLAAGLS